MASVAGRWELSEFRKFFARFVTEESGTIGATTLKFHETQNDLGKL
jgi:hypothetical protein